MHKTRIHFTAATVKCCEAIDWELVQVTFDTEAADIDEENRISEYLLLSANLEFGEDVQMEFHDGEDYDGDRLEKIDLWRNRALAISGRGYEFDIKFDLPEDAFSELRKYLKVLLRSDCFRAGKPADQDDASKPGSAVDLKAHLNSNPEPAIEARLPVRFA